MLFPGRNDNISHASTQSIEEDCTKKVTIKTLRSNGQMENILLCFCPVKDGLFPGKSNIINYGYVFVYFDLTSLKDDEVHDVMIVLRP